jgi:hypothetical protein
MVSMAVMQVDIYQSSAFLRVRLRDYQSRKNIGIVWYVFTGYADFSFFVVDVETGGSNSPMQFHTILIRCTRLPSMRSAL